VDAVGCESNGVVRGFAHGHCNLGWRRSR
jgi:hypothetical protein